MVTGASQCLLVLRVLQNAMQMNDERNLALV
jgi:hypothetical protein